MRKPVGDHRIEQAPARSRWLGELSSALDQAYQLALALAANNRESSEAMMLRIRIQAARAEVEGLRRSTPCSQRVEISPDRISLPPGEFHLPPAND